MKIVQLITGSSSFGGAEAHVRDLATGLRERGHDCTVLVGPPEGLFVDQLRARSIPVVIIPSLKKPIHPVEDAAGLMQILRALRRIQPDIIATHTSKAGMIGRIAAKIADLPAFFTPHGLSFIDRKNGGIIRYRLIMEYIAARLGGRIIPVCEAERVLAIDYLRLNTADISTIHNGLPDTQLAHLQQPVPVITMIARFDIQKDHVTLFDALGGLLSLPWELRLAGSGPLLDPAKDFARRHGLASRTKFLEQCSDTTGLLAETDIFVLVSNWEAFPISILEAMRAGLPVVATDTGGVREAVVDKLNGFLVARSDASAVAAGLSLLLSSKDLRLSMGGESRRRFLQHFEWNAMLDKTEALYESSGVQKWKV